MNERQQIPLFPTPAPSAPDHSESLKWIRDRLIVDESPEFQEGSKPIEYDPDLFIEGGKK